MRRLLAINPVGHPGGAETTLLRLARGLARLGWEVTLTSPAPGPLKDAALADGHRWEPLAVGGLGSGQGARAALSWPRVRRLAQGADAVLLNGVVTGRLIPALKPGSGLPRTRARVVLSVHDIVGRVPRFWRQADVVIAACAAAAEPLRALDPQVVHCPVDLDPPAVEAPWARSEGPVIGFVGRIEPRKGPLDLVRAAPAIRQEQRDARVVLVGDPPSREEDDGYAAEVLASGEAEHHGHREDATSLMRHLDVLVLPSYHEAFGTVLAEAMAVGTPVVTTPVGGLRETVRDGVTGRLVPPGDPPALAAGVLEVLSRRAEMGEAASEWARRFATDAYVERVERVLVGGA